MNAARMALTRATAPLRRLAATSATTSAMPAAGAAPPATTKYEWRATAPTSVSPYPRADPQQLAHAPTPAECLRQLAMPNSKYYAVVELKGSVYHVTKGDLVTVNHIKDLPLGATLALDCVRELGTSDVTLRGAPYVSNVRISATVLEHWHSAKKYSPRVTGLHRHQRKRLLRCHYTTIRVTDISYDYGPGKL